MLKNKSKARESAFKKISIRITIGSIIGTAVFFALAAVVSLIAFKQDIPAQGLDTVILSISAVSAFICGYATVLPIKKNGLVLGLISSAPMYLLIIIIASIINRASLSTTAWIAMSVMLFCGSVGGILAANKIKKQKF